MEKEHSSSNQKTLSAASQQSTDKVLLTIRMERKDLEWAKEFTKQAGINVSHLVRALLEQFRREIEAQKVEQL